MIKQETLFRVSNDLDIFTLLDLCNEMKRRGYEISYNEVIYLWGEDKDIGDLTKTLVDVELENGFKGSTYVYHYCSVKEAHDLYDNRMFKVLPLVNNSKRIYENTSESGSLNIPKSFITQSGLHPKDVCVAFASTTEDEEPCLAVCWNVDPPKADYIRISVNNKGRLVIPKKAFVLADLPWEDKNYLIELTDNCILISDGIHD